MFTTLQIPLRVDNLVTNRRILEELLNDPDFVYEARQSDSTFYVCLIIFCLAHRVLFSCLADV